MAWPSTELLEEGQPIKAVAERLGHSRIGILLDIYTHVTQRQQKEIARSVNSYLAAGLNQG